MNKSNRLNMNLQYFAEPNNNQNPAGSNTEPGPKEPGKGGNNTEPNNKQPQNNSQPKLKYTDEDVNNIVKAKLAKAEEKRKADIAEAIKETQMNNEQKKAYEAKKAKQLAEEAMEKLKHYELRDNVRSQLSESGLTLTDSELELVVDKDEESTNAKVEAIKGLCNRIAEQVKNDIRKGQTPPADTNPANKMSKNEILAIKDDFQRKKAIADNIELFR
ncbi:capsid assembly scaffolding protein Gp46 family protein [Bombilactobacillus mellifer]|uniref:capsid assembly scaffolding protein Gp46 family protein n=1 Tax=Bombilactobacillus mellifer TaxID=1218492 RepID=UPI0023EFB95E|nr:DUF4355 domain-containing protein [Bombilactobacillus mellifer]MCT6826973.1 DUF4355 domain-containing protein [Bombilactobacillus mellifer]